MLIPDPRQPPSSPRVRELSTRIQERIREFQRQFPMTPAEIHEALRHAGAQVGPPSMGGRVLRGALFWLVVIGLPFLVVTILRAFR